MCRRAAGVLLVIISRLLIAGGGGSFTLTAPPFDGSWGTATVWSSPNGGEPSAMYDGGVFKLWGSVGIASPAMGYWTSSDGLSWSFYGNVLGQGSGGVAGTVIRASVAKFGSTFHAYWIDSTGSTGNVHHATSSDGTTWTDSGIVLANNASANFTGWANSAVWQEGSTWHMLLEGWNTSISPANWRIVALTSSDGTTWSFENSGNPLTTLETYPGGSYGGPDIACVGNVQTPTLGGLYHLWFHGQSTSSSVPTPTYHSTSVDRITWTTPTLVWSGLPQSGHTWDQTSDPAILTAKGSAFLYYGGVDNAGGFTDNGGGVTTAPAH